MHLWHLKHSYNYYTSVKINSSVFICSCTCTYHTSYTCYFIYFSFVDMVWTDPRWRICIPIPYHHGDGMEADLRGPACVYNLIYASSWQNLLHWRQTLLPVFHREWRKRRQQKCPVRDKNYNVDGFIIIIIIIVCKHTKRGVQIKCKLWYRLGRRHNIKYVLKIRIGVRMTTNLSDNISTQ